MDILYEDNHLLAAYKPAGLLTQSTDLEADSLEERARQYIKVKKNKPGNVYLHVVHRLDKPTAGIVMMALTSKALSRLNTSKDSWQKTYWALAESKPAPKAGRLEHWHSKGNYRATVRPSVPGQQVPKGAKRAVLNYRYIARSGSKFLLHVELETGRYHQIRAQLAAAGWPIAGDSKYGRAGSGKHSGDSAVQIGLWNVRLKLNHPVGGAPLCLVRVPSTAEWESAV